MSAATASAPSRSDLGLTTRRLLGLAACIGVLLLTVAASLAIGARTIGIGEVWAVLWHPDGSDDAVIVRDLRVPRTVLGLLVGGALGLSGALMQALTRNPLADPGIFGIGAGAAAALVAGTLLTGSTSLSVLVWFSLAGAAAASVLVYGIAAGGSAGSSPIRLALAGAAIAAALTALINGLTLTFPSALDQYRFWSVGSIAGQPIGTAWQVLPFIAVGAVITFVIGPALNAVALGDDQGRALGVNLGRTRILAAIAVTLLCGAATAAAGPIVFIGLAVPHAARAFVGPDQRWVLPYSLVLGGALVLAADVLGRVVVRPSELETGVVCALAGAPLFIALVRRRRIPRL